MYCTILDVRVPVLGWAMGEDTRAGQYQGRLGALRIHYQPCPASQDSAVGTASSSELLVFVRFVTVNYMI